MLRGGWVLRLRLCRSDHRERTGVECHDESLKGLVQHSRGTPGKSLCQPERWEIVAVGAFQLCVLADSRTLPSWMPEVRCAAVCGPRGGQAGWLPPKQVPEIGGKVPRQSPAPEVGMTSTMAPTKLSAGKSHCLYLCCLALPRDPRPGASSPGGADNLPEAVVTPYRSLRPQVFLALPNCIRHITPSAQTDCKWALISRSFCLHCLGGEHTPEDGL